MDLKNFMAQNKGMILAAALVALACAALVLGIISYARNSGMKIDVKDTGAISHGEIFVHVKGAVNSPGIYKLPRGSRVNDAVMAAGGALENADVERINLAKQLEDGQELIVPSKAPKGEKVDDGRININTADKKALCELPGIGNETAERIIEYREQRGGFSDVSELLRVSGIGKSKLEKIKDRVKVYD